MKTSNIIWNLVVALITASGLSLLVHGKRQKPRRDEIERVINNTHSVIWKCSNTECPTGTGLTVFCGTSVSFSVDIECVSCVKGVNFSRSHDYSTCKSCRNCGKYENKTGECTLDEDTTKCLGICHKGFYMDKITGDCHPCSDCCSSIEAKKYHEKQCEDSGLPMKQQCRMSNIKCDHHPTEAADEKRDDDQKDDQGVLQLALKIAAIVSCSLLFIITIALIVIWRCYGWERAKMIVKECCCWCCRLLKSSGGNTVYFQRNVHFEADNVESAMSGDVTVGTTKTVPKTRKWPSFQRQSSVPVKTPNANLKNIARSSSHPGCLNKLLLKESWEIKRGSLKKLFLDQRSKKLTKKGYTSVPTDQPIEIDDLRLAANLGSDLPGKTLQSVVVAPDHGMERLEKPSVKEQCTSTTGLHQSGTTQVADIPQKFLCQCLNKKSSAIPIKFYRKICLKLDTLRECFWNDYRLLGEKIGLSKDEISWLGQSGNPTELIIQKFDSQKDSSIGKFKSILQDMERNDVVTIIEEWIQDEWYKCNNSSSVIIA